MHEHIRGHAYLRWHCMAMSPTSHELRLLACTLMYVCCVTVTTHPPFQTDSSHGMRCWNLGGTRVGPADFHPNWDQAKVGVMLAVNWARYVQHKDLRTALLGTRSAKIVGGPSTAWRLNGKYHDWGMWNGAIQALCREGLRKPQERDPKVVQKLLHQFRNYGNGTSEEILQQVLAGIPGPDVTRRAAPDQPHPVATNTHSHGNSFAIRTRPVLDADLSRILACDQAVYPTDNPLTEDTLRSLLRQQPSMGMVYVVTKQQHATDAREPDAVEKKRRAGQEHIVGLSVCFALNVKSWHLLLQGKLTEAGVVAGEGGRHLVNLADANTGSSCEVRPRMEFVCRWQ